MCNYGWTTHNGCGHLEQVLLGFCFRAKRTFSFSPVHCISKLTSHDLPATGVVERYLARFAPPQTLMAYRIMVSTSRYANPPLARH